MCFTGGGQGQSENPRPRVVRLYVFVSQPTVRQGRSQVLYPVPQSFTFVPARTRDDPPSWRQGGAHPRYSWLTSGQRMPSVGTHAICSSRGPGQLRGLEICAEQGLPVFLRGRGRREGMGRRFLLHRYPRPTSRGQALLSGTASSFRPPAMRVVCKSEKALGTHLALWSTPQLRWTADCAACCKMNALA